MIENMPRNTIIIADIMIGTNSCFVKPKNWGRGSIGTKSRNDGNSGVLSLPPLADTELTPLSYFLIEKLELIFSEGALTGLFI